MFNVFKKNSKGTIENQCSEEKVLTPEVLQDQTLEVVNFISAKEALEKSRLKWKSVTLENICEEIYKEIKNGKREVCFFKSCISDEQKEYFQKLGYRVKTNISSWDNTPYFEISW